MAFQIQVGNYLSDSLPEFTCCSRTIQYRQEPDYLVHQMLTLRITINPEKGPLWDPDRVDCYWYC